MAHPNWVSEGSVRKYDRAVELLRKEKLAKPETDNSPEAIKALYIKYGGLVIEHESTEEVEAPKKAPKK